MHQSFDGVTVSKKVDPKIENADCYVFPLHQVYLKDGRFQQSRSGPNWLGGVLTMATCKHFLRTTRMPEEWGGVYLAGFTPKIDGENYLLFLAKVKIAFASNYALGTYLRSNHPEAYDSKSSAKNDRGDIFHPKRKVLKGDEIYDHTNYVVTPTHVRTELKKGRPKWWSDVDYSTKNGKRPAVLLFDQSFILFDRPVYKAVRPLYRSGYRCQTREFITQFIEKV